MTNLQITNFKILFLLFFFFLGFGNWKLEIGTSCLAQPFEGIIKSEYFVAENNSTIFLTWYITSAQVALEMKPETDSNSTPQITKFIMREDDDVMNILTTMPDGKKYFTQMEEKSIHAGEGFNYKSFETVKTDEFSVHHEFKCRKLFSKTNAIKSTCWVAEDLTTNIIDYSKFMKSDYDILAMRNWDMTGFPLKSVTTTLSGDLVSTMIVKEIIPQKINKAEFEIPKDAKEWKEKN